MNSAVKISKKSLWDQIHVSSRPKNVAVALKRYWTRKQHAFFQEYLSEDPHKKFVEIGGAPGTSAIFFHQMLGYEPYVFDYSEIGIQKTKENFRQFAVSPANAVVLDFLDENRVLKYQDFFDVVASYGFVEHFTNPDRIVDLHVAILKKGGDLIITVPANTVVFRLQPIFQSGIVEQHNLSIMSLDGFREVFMSRPDIEIRYLDYFGGINLCIPLYKNTFMKYGVYLLQKGIELTRLEALIPHNRFTSPYLVCIARKK